MITTDVYLKLNNPYQDEFVLKEYDFDYYEWVNLTNQFSEDEKVLVSCIFISKKILDLLKNNIRSIGLIV